MITIRALRSWLAVAFFPLGVFAFGSAFILFGRPVVDLLLRLGLVGTWGKAAFFAFWTLALLLTLEAAIRLAFLCAGIPRPPGAAKAFAFGLGLFLSIGAWLLTASFLAPLLRPHVASALAEWLQIVLSLVGVFALGALADRIRPRFGIYLKGERRK